MITVVIADAEEGQPPEATMNIRIEPSASPDDMRQAWEYALNGMFQKHLYHSICVACIDRGIDPRMIVAEPPSN
jgi:hypothetical protein